MIGNICGIYKIGLPVSIANCCSLACRPIMLQREGNKQYHLT